MWPLLLSLLTLSAAAQTSAVGNGAAQPTLAPLAGLPLCFELNRGQAGGPAQFLARGPNYHFLIAPSEAELVLRSVDSPMLVSRQERAKLIGPHPAWIRTVRMQFAGANAQAQIHGQDAMPGKINYLLGNDPALWLTGIAAYSKVQVKQLYPGITLVYYGNQQQLEYDFTVAPGANPAAIALHFDGVDRLVINQQGELILMLGEEAVRQPAPRVYQMAGGARQRISGGYRLKDPTTVEFAVGRYDRSLPLVIDPVLTYSTLLGGNVGDTALSVKLDASGSVYVAGVTLSTLFDFPHSGGFQATNAGGVIDGDAFVAKFDPTGTNLVYFTYLGGTNDDGAYDMALDSSNNVYLTGFTDSPNFPVVPASGVPGLPTGRHIAGTPDPKFNVFAVDAFVTELDASGQSLVFSTFLGGSGADVAGGIAVDISNYVYVTGFTYSTNFPIANALVFQPPGAIQPRVFDSLSGSNDVFVAKFAPAGAGLVYSTYLGGTNVDEGEGIAADANGYAYVTGFTASTNFPITADAMQKDFNHATNATVKYYGVRLPAFDGFVAQIAPNGSDLVYASYLGGTNLDGGNRIVVDAATNVYVTGYSESADFTNTVSTNIIRRGITNNLFVNADAFLTKLSFASSPPALVYSALFGGDNNDAGWDVAVDTSGNAYVVGVTASTNFPTANTNGFIQATNAGGDDVFVTAFNPDASAVLYSIYLGGAKSDFGYGIAVDSQGSAWIIGRTLSTNFPVVAPFAAPFQFSNAFLARIETAIPVETVVVDTLPTGLTVVVDGTTNTAPVTNNWLFGSTHAISTPATQSGGSGIQYAWTFWSDSGALSHQVPVLGSGAIVANFTTQYFLTMNSTNGGAVEPPSGWYEAGTNVTIKALTAIGASFGAWTGVGSGSFTGTNNPAVVTMEGPITESASFTGLLTNILTVFINGKGSVSPDYNGQTLQVGHVYTMTAKPASGYLFASWIGGAQGATPGLVTFTMENGLVLVANFIPNPFVTSQGNYAGLFFDTNAVASQNAGFDAELFLISGFFSANLSTSGSFSAKLQAGPRSYSLSGQFSMSGAFSTTIARPGLSSLLVLLRLDLAGGNTITGQINDGLRTAQLVANRAIFSSANPAPQAGKKYTLAISGSTTSFTQPNGDGFGTVQVDSAGNVLFSGTLSDGAKISQKTFLSGQGLWPFYVPLSSGGGSIFGWLAFANQPGNDFSGPVTWLKAPTARTQFYPAGFTFETMAAGSLYSFVNGARVLNFSQGQVVLQNGDLTHSITNIIRIDANNKVTSLSANRLNLSITTSSGLFSGSIVDPVTGRTLTLNGALLQKPDLGAGFFLGTNQSGSVLIGP